MEEEMQKEAWLCNRNQIWETLKEDDSKLDEKTSSETELTTEFDLEDSDFVRCGVNKPTKNKHRSHLVPNNKPDCYCTMWSDCRVDSNTQLW